MTLLIFKLLWFSLVSWSLWFSIRSFLNIKIFLRHIMTSIKLGTHNGSFHCDEILALAMLQIQIFLPPAMLFLMSAGSLILRDIATTIISPSYIVNTLFTQVYKSFVAEVDAIDNGIAITSVPPNYTINTGLSSRVGRHNPAWNMPDEDENECFMRAFKMVDGEFVHFVKAMATSWYPARDIVKQAITTRFSVHPSGYIMRITGPGCPWKTHFFDLEKNLVPGVADISKQDSDPSDFRDRPVFMITERKTPNGTEYNVLTISCRQDQPFTQRVSLASAFAGKRGEELSKLVGIDGAVFVHVNRFIGIHKTLEGALHMAVVSLEEAKYL
nr:hypothetical transcript [Hymenolepis microstoma]